jgi:RNA-directed DNA polymerase
MRMQMTADKAGALKDDADKWNSIDWKDAEREVRRLQVRIAKAVKENRWNKVKTLQYLLTHSFYTKLLAVKRVTSNKGKKTPGVDGVLWRGARAKWRAACSLRRRGYHP